MFLPCMMGSLHMRTSSSFQILVGSNLLKVHAPSHLLRQKKRSDSNSNGNGNHIQISTEDLDILEQISLQKDKILNEDESGMHNQSRSDLAMLEKPLIENDDSNIPSDTINTLQKLAPSNDQNDISPSDTSRDSSASPFLSTSIFLFRAALVGLFTGITGKPPTHIVDGLYTFTFVSNIKILVVVFKTAILATSVLFYESIANLLPRPVFYWPMALCKIQY